MSIQSDRWIREQALRHRMIEPISEKQVSAGIIPNGRSSYGYDLRVFDEFKVSTNKNSALIDPRAFDERPFVSVQARSVIVPPNSFALARFHRILSYPPGCIDDLRWKIDLCALRDHKGTQRAFEPEWEGFVTLEISSTTPLPAKVYANEGLCQNLFFRSDEACEIGYADREGKYQNQKGIALPELE